MNLLFHFSRPSPFHVIFADRDANLNSIEKLRSFIDQVSEKNFELHGRRFEGVGVVLRDTKNGEIWTALNGFEVCTRRGQKGCKYPRGIQPITVFGALVAKNKFNSHCDHFIKTDKWKVECAYEQAWGVDLPLQAQREIGAQEQLKTILFFRMEGKMNFENPCDHPQYVYFKFEEVGINSLSDTVEHLLHYAQTRATPNDCISTRKERAELLPMYKLEEDAINHIDGVSKREVRAYFEENQRNGCELYIPELTSEELGRSYRGRRTAKVVCAELWLTTSNGDHLDCPKEPPRGAMLNNYI